MPSTIFESIGIDVAGFDNSITTVDATWIGLGPAAGRIEFDDQATDLINFLDCNVLIEATNRLETAEVRAISAAGLGLYDDAGAGIFVEDGGQVGIGTATPGTIFEVSGPANRYAHVDVRTNTDGMPDQGAVNNSGIIKIFENDDDGFLAFSHYGSGSLAYFYGDNTRQWEIWGWDYAANGGAGKHGAVLNIRAINNASEIQLREFNDSDCLRMKFWTGPPKFAEIYTEQAGTEIYIGPNAANMILMNQGGNLGIGTTAPDRLVDILDATNPQLRLTHTDDTIYVDMQCDANGDLIITPSDDMVEVVGGYINTSGGYYMNAIEYISPEGADLRFWRGAGGNVKFFSSAGANENPEVMIYGRPVGAATRDYASFQIINTTWDLDIYPNAAGAAVLIASTGGHDLGLGTSNRPTANGGRVFFVGDNTADPTMGVDTAGFYGKDVAGTVEAFAIDEAGNAAQLTPHGFELFERPDPHAWSVNIRNEREGYHINVDMWSALRALEKITGEKFIYEKDLR